MQDMEEIEIILTSSDILVVRLCTLPKDKTLAYMNVTFSVKNKYDGKFTHTHGETLIDIITLYSPLKTPVQAIRESAEITEKILDWFDELGIEEEAA